MIPASCYIIIVNKITILWWIDSRDCQFGAVDGSHVEFISTIADVSRIIDQVRLW